MDSLANFFSSTDFLSNFLFAAISAIVGFLIYIVDRRGNKRQEEALDIILDQVSKVNQFQTRSLVLAINTLENELNDIKQMVSVNKDILQHSNEISTPISQPLSSPISAKDSNKSHEPGFGELISSKFSEVISGQVNNLLYGIQSNLDELKSSTEKETYKKKKGLEFDLKSLIRNLEGLEDLKIEIGPNKSKSKSVSRSPKGDDKIIEPEIVDSTSIPDKNTRETENEKTSLEDFEEKLGSMKSISDIESLVESVTNLFSSNKNKETNFHTTKKRRKVNPEDINKE